MPKWFIPSPLLISSRDLLSNENTTTKTSKFRPKATTTTTFTQLLANNCVCFCLHPHTWEKSSQLVVTHNQVKQEKRTAANTLARIIASIITRIIARTIAWMIAWIIARIIAKTIAWIIVSVIARIMAGEIAKIIA